MCMCCVCMCCVYMLCVCVVCVVQSRIYCSVNESNCADTAQPGTATTGGLAQVDPC